MQPAANRVPDEHRVWTTEQLGQRWNVSTKTITRWRSQGLIGQYYVIDGRRRLGFPQREVERFLRENSERVRRGSQFSQLSERQRLAVVAEAKALAAAGGQPAEILKRLAGNVGRNVETIRYIVKQHDRDNPGRGVFDVAEGPEAEQARREIYRRFRRGESAESLARRFCHTPASLRRLMVRMRHEEIQALPLDFIANEQFERAVSASDEQAILGPAPTARPHRAGVRTPEGLPPYLAGLYAIPLLNAEQERHLFRKMNYLKFKAAALRDMLGPERPSAVVMDRIEHLHNDAVNTKNEIVQANLRLVVSIAKRYAQSPGHLFELISDGNISLMQAAEKFDFARGNKFSTYASWAVMKNFARSIPREYKQHDRFRTSTDEMFSATEDRRNNPYEKESAQATLEADVEGILECLDPREQKIISCRFGLGDQKQPLTLKQIGAVMGVTKERVRQVEGRAMAKLRAAAEQRRIDLPEVA